MLAVIFVSDLFWICEMWIIYYIGRPLYWRSPVCDGLSTMFTKWGCTRSFLPIVLVDSTECWWYKKLIDDCYSFWSHQCCTHSCRFPYTDHNMGKLNGREKKKKKKQLLMWHSCSRFQLTTDCNRMVSHLLLQAISSYWAWAGKEKARAEVSSIASRVRLSERRSSPACRSRCNNWATPLLPLPPWNNIWHANQQFLPVDPTTS